MTRDDSDRAADLFAACSRNVTPASARQAAYVLYAPFSHDPQVSRHCAAVLAATELQRADRFVAEYDKTEFKQRRAFRRFCGATVLGSSRPYRKNDNCVVEQKNYSVVRRHAGYGRYDTETEVQLLNQLYEQLRLYVNFFLPSQKLIEKIRRGSRVQKRYDQARTPYRRVLESEQVTERCKKKLRSQYQQLNPAELDRQIRRLEEELLYRATQKWRAAAVDDAVPCGKASRFPTSTWKTPPEFPTPTTASTTTTT
jgi:hypothetical protein